MEFLHENSNPVLVMIEAQLPNSRMNLLLSIISVLSGNYKLSGYPSSV